MYNILVTGANGQLGSEIRELEASYSQHHFFYTDVATLDITDKKAIALFIQENKITAIINCAAYTAVDKAESEPKLADKINLLAVQYLAEAAKVYDCSSFIFQRTMCSMAQITSLTPKPINQTHKACMAVQN